MTELEKQEQVDREALRNAAIALGRKGGQRKSKAKTEAAKANIRKRWYKGD